MKHISSLINSIFRIDRFWEIFRAYVITLLFSFLTYKYLSVKGFDVTQVRLIAGIFFSIFLFLYLSIFDTRLKFPRKLAIGLLNLINRFKIVVYLFLFGLLIFMARRFFLSQDWLSLPYFRFFITAVISISIGLILGILFSLNNLSRVWAAGALNIIVILLFVLIFVLLAICIYAGYVLNILFRTSLLILVTTFLLVHFRIRLRTIRAEIIEKNISDFHDYSTIKTATLYYNWVGNGRIFLALSHLLLNKFLHKYFFRFKFLNKHVFRSKLFNEYIFRNSFRQIGKKDYYKILARIFYRMGVYDWVLWIVKKAQGMNITSDVLISLRGLAYFEKGNIKEALEVLHKAYSEDCKKTICERNPYFAFNLGYIYWALSEMSSDLSEAIKYTEEALEIRPECSMAHNNLAFFKLELARLHYYTDQTEFYRLLNEASQLIRKAFRYSKKRYYTLYDTWAYLRMMKDKFDISKRFLLQSAPVDIDARIHLALIFMTESELYDKSLCYLKRVLLKLRTKKWHRNYKIARRLLDIIKSARGEGVFKWELLFCYDKKELPESAWSPAMHKETLGKLDNGIDFIRLIFSWKYSKRILIKLSEFFKLLRPMLQHNRLRG